MARLRKLTRDQKILVTKQGIDPTGYYLRQELMNTFIIVNPTTKDVQVVEK